MTAPAWYALAQVGVVIGLTLCGVVVADRSRRGVFAALGFVALFAVDTAQLWMLPRGWLGWDLDFNWQGKLVTVALALGVLARWAATERAMAGWRWEVNAGAARPLVWWTIGVTLLLSVPYYLATPERVLSWEKVLFQATMPGLAEELMYRGVLLYLLDRAWGTPWRWGGAAMGWGAVVTSAAFGVVHGVVFTVERGLIVDWPALVATGLLGLLFAWMRARAGALWPAVLAHNVVNVGSAF